jgi:hypothetical protein
MKCADEIASEGNYCFARENDLYVVYLPEGKPASLKLPAGNYEVQWFNPRTGGNLQPGNMVISEKGTVSTGNTPVADGKDWVCMLKRKNG